MSTFASDPETLATCPSPSFWPGIATGVTIGVVVATMAEAVSVSCIVGLAVLPAGADMRYAVTVTVSPAFVFKKLTVATAAEAVEVSFVSCVDVAAESVSEPA